MGGLDTRQKIQGLPEIEKEEATKEGGGDRYNSGKPEISMVLEASHALEGCARVLTFGKEKYSRGNWRQGLSHTEVADSLLRHMTAYLAGEDSDGDSGLPHVDHILCNALFLAEMTRTHSKLDDRSTSS